MEYDPKDLISIDAPRTDFEQFLSKDNKRVFFSGQFGIGKTFFLKEFFKSDKRKWEYDVYHLFPVNYQISSNENIVEFLKYDILVELLNKYSNAFESTELNGIKEKLRFFVAFCKDRGLVGRVSKVTIKSLFALTPNPIFTPLSRLGRSLKDLTTFREEFQEFEAEKLSGDKDAIDEFLEQIKIRADIVATDYVSQLLREKIAILKDGRRSILILDDFDRIDPEHTFRILNVLSTHIDGDEENKFGFDHIIIVGDIENLRNIFHHKYGDKTDFWGYFDKFFTVEPYSFDNEKAIAERIPHLTQSIQCEDDEDLKEVMGPGGVISILLQTFLGQALSVKATNLRQLYKPVNHLFSGARKENYGRWFRSTNIHFNKGVNLLIAIYRTEDDFLNALERVRANSSLDVPDRNKEFVYKWLAHFMLKRMVPLEDVGQKLWLDNKYTLTLMKEKLGGFEQIIALEGGTHPRFFFDTLYEYIRKSEHKKLPPNDDDDH